VSRASRNDFTGEQHVGKKIIGAEKENSLGIIRGPHLLECEKIQRASRRWKGCDV